MEEEGVVNITVIYMRILLVGMRIESEVLKMFTIINPAKKMEMRKNCWDDN